jgi:hypothetical protein
MARSIVPTLPFVLLVAAAAWPQPTQAGALEGTSDESRACASCHLKSSTPVVVQPWMDSRHAAAGIGCYECHQAGKNDPDAFEHEGLTISVLVTPKDCAQCHEQ